MNAKPCPACDASRMQMSPLTAMALGVGLGASHSDMHQVTELMCSMHRPMYVMAMARAAIVSNTLADEDERGGAA